MTEPSELDGFWRGDDHAIEAIYRAHLAALLGAARWVVGPAEDESIVQEVFVELIRNEELRRRFTGGAISSWLGAITRLKALDHRKRAGQTAPANETPRGDEQPSPEPRVVARDLLQRFLRVEKVSELQERFFRLRFLDRRTQVEVAAELGVPRSTLEGWEHRFSRRFRRFVGESGR